MVNDINESLHVFTHYGVLYGSLDSLYVMMWTLQLIQNYDIYSVKIVMKKRTGCDGCGSVLQTCSGGGSDSCHRDSNTYSPRVIDISWAHFTCPSPVITPPHHLIPLHEHPVSTCEQFLAAAMGVLVGVWALLPCSGLAWAIQCRHLS